MADSNSTIKTFSAEETARMREEMLTQFAPMTTFEDMQPDGPRRPVRCTLVDGDDELL